MDVHIQGGEELKALLKRAARSMEKREVRAIIAEEMKPVAEIAKQDAGAMVNRERKTFTGKTRSGEKYTLRPGAIARSIKVMRMNRARVPMAIVAPKITAKYDSGWFAHFVHEGTANRQTNKGHNRGQITGTKVQKFMNRAGSQGVGSAGERVTRRLMAKLNELGL